MKISKTIMLIITFIVLVCISGFSGFYLGNLDKESVNNHPPAIRDMWVSHYPYAIKDDRVTSTDTYPPFYGYPYAYNVDIRDYDGDFVSVRFYIKQGNTWILEQEQFGRDGIYTFYPYTYEYPIPMEGYYMHVIAKIVISDNVNTVSRGF